MRTGLALHAVLLFDGFEFDVQRRSLRRAVARRALGAWAFDVLVALVQRRGRVVGKDDHLAKEFFASGTRARESGERALSCQA